MRTFVITDQSGEIQTCVETSNQSFLLQKNTLEISDQILWNKIMMYPYHFKLLNNNIIEKDSTEKKAEDDKRKVPVASSNLEIRVNQIENRLNLLENPKNH